MNGAILGLYNYREMAGHLGDHLIFHGILEMMKHDKGANRIDLLCVDDPTNPLQPTHLKFFDKNPGPREMLYEQWKVLSKVGKIIRLDSDAEFTEYFQANAKDYNAYWPHFPLNKTWPSPVINKLDFSVDGTTYHHMHQPLGCGYDKFGFLPKLSCPEYILSKVRHFMSEKMGLSKKPIVIQVRVRDDERDGNLNAWHSLLEHVASQEECCVFVPCFQGEQEQFRDIDGLVFTKDYLSGFLYDLACIQLSWMTVFPNGGLVPWVWFTGTPAIVFGKTRGNVHFLETSGLQNDQETFLFAPMCYHHWGPYDRDILVSGFESFKENLDYVNPYW